MELNINEYQLPAEIKFNYEDIKQELIAKVGIYETMVYTDDQIANAKKDKATLNKLKKTLNDKRIELERDYMKPFETFKGQIKELCTLIDKPVEVIDKQIKAAEEERRANKKAEIEEIFDKSTHPDWLSLARIFNDKWLNATYKIKDIEAEMNMALSMIEGNLNTLQALPEFGFEAIEEYKRTLDMNKAIMEGKRLAEIQKRKEEEQKRREEEAQKIEEQKKAEEIQQVEEKPEKVEEVKPVEEAEEPASWRTFGAFLTERQYAELIAWADAQGINFTEV